MVTWEELELEARLRQESQERTGQAQAARVDSKQRQKEQTSREQADLQAKRKLKEEERWGTPERAYQTWQQRAQDLTEYINQCRNEFEAEARLARDRYDKLEFPLYRRRGPNFKVDRRPSRTVAVNSFSYRGSPESENVFVLQMGHGLCIGKGNDIL